ncbi:MAG: D-alanine--D-alanine ligase [Ignavibacteriales bacterium]|nr:D-alanine--D-alanine ligase [Ignavibacteriales bacterium]
MNKENITVAILLGGTSPERAVSKESGKAIYYAVKNLGYKTKIIDPAFGLNQPQNIDDYFCDCEFSKISNENMIAAINSPFFDDVDLALIALHGKWGEDGVIQSLLELRGIKYTGSGVLASSLSMDKAKSKIIFNHFGVYTPEWLEASKHDDLKILSDKIESTIKYPCIIKPNDQGSTIGLTKCNNFNELENAINLASQFSKKILLERFIAGREIAVAIVKDFTLPILEIIPKHEIYDYECKYSDGMSEYIVPAAIDKNIENELQRQAVLAFNSLGCEHYSRIDFRLTKEGIPYCLEINTLPGMTSHSLVPKIAKAQGIGFEELVDIIISSAL